jgi:hypothetical protein
MADERDPQISRRYRQLGAEEPSAELDRAILGAARRATSRHRWYSSLAAAAVLIFAVALVVQLERQPPDQVPTSAPATTVAAPSSDKPAAPQREAPPATPAPRRRAEPAPQFAPAPAPEPNANVAAPAAAAAADAERKRTDETRAAPQLQRSIVPARSAPAAAQANLVETPDQWLARIARMRQLGQDDEAEKELARFRERYPDYRIPEAMAKKLEKQVPSPAAR